jgi:hypothetical protein
VTFAPEAGLETIKVDQPPPEVLDASTTSAGARVYRGPFTLGYNVRVRPGRGASPSRVRGTLRYQACTDRICYKPEAVRIEWIRPRGENPPR